MSEDAPFLLQELSERIIMRYLEKVGRKGVARVARVRGLSNPVDIAYEADGRLVRVKVKPDAYYGSDPWKLADRSLVFYRPESTAFALESIGDARTREAGWALKSGADELFYYSIAIGQPEDEVAALLHEPDDVFFAELDVERDELRVIPMKDVRRWFEGAQEEYPARPVFSAEGSAWYRLVPKADLEIAVPSARVVSPVFSTLRG